MNSLWVFQHLFHSRIDCRSLSFNCLDLPFDKSLYYFQATFEFHLVHPHIHILFFLSNFLDFLKFLLDFCGCVLPHLKDSSDKDLQFDDVSDYYKGKDFLFYIFVLDVPIILDDIINVKHSLYIPNCQWLPISKRPHLEWKVLMLLRVINIPFGHVFQKHYHIIMRWLDWYTIHVLITIYHHSLTWELIHVVRHLSRIFFLATEALVFIVNKFVALFKLLHLPQTFPWTLALNVFSISFIKLWILSNQRLFWLVLLLLLL